MYDLIRNILVGICIWFYDEDLSKSVHYFTKEDLVAYDELIWLGNRCIKATFEYVPLSEITEEDEMRHNPEEV